MCFYVMPGSTKQIAKEDIECYKFIRRKINSRELIGAYQSDYRYTLNRILSIDDTLKPIGSKYKTIYNGFHSYTCKRMIEDKLHSRKTGYRCRRNGYNYSVLIPVLCIILKGSTYYINTRDSEYVSNRLIIKEVFFKN